VTPSGTPNASPHVRQLKLGATAISTGCSAELLRIEQMQERDGLRSRAGGRSQLVPSDHLGVADEPPAFAALRTSSKVVFAAPFPYIS
jgi:hypothetical protein